MTYELMEQMKQEAIQRLNYLVYNYGINKRYLNLFKTNGRPASGYLGKVFDTTEGDMWDIRKAEYTNDFLVYAVIINFDDCGQANLYFLTVSADKTKWPEEINALNSRDNIQLDSNNHRRVLTFNNTIESIFENRNLILEEIAPC